MTTATPGNRQDFPAACRQWRQYRKLSQLDLALVANVSQRHVSWLETGRSQPSRAMVVRLADAMDIPLRERNFLFQAAGYSAAYRETQLDELAMAPVLVPLAIWIYTLVFAFSSLWFAHYALDALEHFRKEKEALAQIEHARAATEMIATDRPSAGAPALDNHAGQKT